MYKLQVIVTSYQRLNYLKQCIESLRKDFVEIFVADGGSDSETRKYIVSMADGWIFFDGNPGADFLKTEGIKTFVSNPEFMITSDDLVYPSGYSNLLLEQYRLLNKDGLGWSFCACNKWEIENNPHYLRQFIKVNGVEILPVATCQVAGAIIDYDLCESVGFFPNYGRSGQGDWAFSKRLRDVGIKMGYFKRPICKHIGHTKAIDYPEYSAVFARDENKYFHHAREDDGNIIASNSIGVVGWRND